MTAAPSAIPSTRTERGPVRPSTARPALHALTGVRFLAAMPVLLFHYYGPDLAARTDVVANVVRSGYIGVSLFFVLSGFILAYTYVGDDGRMRGSALAFWWARAARVYPVYALALVVTLPLFVAGLRHHLVPASASIATAVLTPALLQSWWPPASCGWNCPGWSLSVEVLFYALFPAVVAWYGRRRVSTPLARGFAAWLVCLAPPLLYLALAPDGVARTTPDAGGFWLTALKFFPPLHLGEFALGVACGWTFLQRSRQPSARALPSGVTAAAAVAVLASVALGNRLPYPLLHTGLLAPAFAVIIYALAQGGGRVGRVLGSRPVVRLGEASYALYLLHEPVRSYVHVTWRAAGWRAENALGAAVATVLAIVTSLVVFARIEEPARKALRRRNARSVVSERPGTTTSTCIRGDAPFGRLDAYASPEAASTSA